ncbi:hypothetical protein [Citrobacter freundii]|uniref:hypothetical protein n=1 Tax=Citrobacter freundii TaxID=546 RepID=UPI00374FC89A
MTINKQACDKLKLAAAKAVDNFDPNMFVETRDVLALLNENARLMAERDALRETMGGDNTRAAADIYFQLVEECEIPAGGSLVEYIDDMRDRLNVAENHAADLDNALCELLPGVQYMDPPGGGSVTPLEQVRRMVADYRERIAELEQQHHIKPCPKCNDTGMADSGGTQPWGEPIEIECDCRQQDANTAELVAAGIITKVGE